MYFSFDFVKSGTSPPPPPIVSMSLKWSTQICSKGSYILFISAICLKQVILDSPSTESPRFMMQLIGMPQLQKMPGILSRCMIKPCFDASQDSDMTCRY